jgi:hypothetical protein
LEVSTIAVVEIALARWRNGRAEQTPKPNRESAERGG